MHFLSIYYKKNYSKTAIKPKKKMPHLISDFFFSHEVLAESHVQITGYSI